MPRNQKAAAYLLRKRVMPRERVERERTIAKSVGL